VQLDWSGHEDLGVMARTNIRAGVAQCTEALGGRVLGIKVIAEDRQSVVIKTGGEVRDIAPITSRSVARSAIRSRVLAMRLQSGG